MEMPSFSHSKPNCKRSFPRLTSKLETFSFLFIPGFPHSFPSPANLFHFIHSRRIAYLLQRFSRILDERRANPGRKQVIIIDGSATTFIIYFLLDVFFLLYCIWLMLHEVTWTPGFLLLVIAALESLAIHARISGAYDEDEEGFVYPRTWLRYLCFGESMFILLRLFEGA